MQKDLLKMTELKQTIEKKERIIENLYNSLAKVKSNANTTISKDLQTATNSKKKKISFLAS